MAERAAMGAAMGVAMEAEVPGLLLPDRGEHRLAEGILQCGAG